MQLRIVNYAAVLLMKEPFGILIEYVQTAKLFSLPVSYECSKQTSKVNYSSLKNDFATAYNSRQNLISK